MANSDYTYAQVKSGSGTYRYESPSSYSAGVKTMQDRLEDCGYTITDTDGHFGASTRLAVRRFQQTIYGMSSSNVDGIAGKNTLTQLDTVYQSLAFSFGVSLCSTPSSWTRSQLASSSWNNYRKRIDALARVIFGEDNDSNAARAGGAKVIYNRANASSSSFRNPSAANKFMAVISCSGQYSTVPSSAWSCNGGDDYDSWPTDGTRQRVLVTRRGSSSASNNYINPAWKNAVELAYALENGSNISTQLGYPITVSSSGTITVGSSATRSMTSSHLYQVGYSKFAEWVNDGISMSQILNYTGEKSGNIFLVR